MPDNPLAAQAAQLRAQAQELRAQANRAEAQAHESRAQADRLEAAANALDGAPAAPDRIDRAAPVAHHPPMRRRKGIEGKSPIARAIAPVTLVEAASRVGVGASALYSYATGRRAAPGWLVQRFVEAFDVAPDAWPKRE